MQNDPNHDHTTAPSVTWNPALLKSLTAWWWWHFYCLQGNMNHLLQAIILHTFQNPTPKHNNSLRKRFNSSIVYSNVWPNLSHQLVIKIKWLVVNFIQFCSQCCKTFPTIVNLFQICFSICDDSNRSYKISSLENMSFTIPFLVDFLCWGCFFALVYHSNVVGFLQRDAFLENMHGKGNSPEEC